MVPDKITAALIVNENDCWVEMLFFIRVLFEK